MKKVFTHLRVQHDSNHTLSQRTAAKVLDTLKILPTISIWFLSHIFLFDKLSKTLVVLNNPRYYEGLDKVNLAKANLAKANLASSKKQRQQYLSLSPTTHL
jgi:hypothetical protein